MARTPAQRGKIGNWLVESRMARGWDTQEKARAEIQRLTGWRIPQSVYAEWESGRRIPADANLGRTTPSSTRRRRVARAICSWRDSGITGPDMATSTGGEMNSTPGSRFRAQDDDRPLRRRYGTGG